MSAKPFFIVSSGRSGTAMLHKALSAQSDVEMHHEYMVHIVQPLGVRRYMNLIDREAAKRTLLETHVAAVRYCARPHWGDSSNKLSWLIPELAELLPDAKFVHLVRDGRKVASSYFHKLAEECYDDRSTAILRAHVRDGAAAAAGEEILVAVAGRPRRFRRLRPVPAHRLALGGDQPGDPGFARGPAARAQPFRAA